MSAFIYGLMKPVKKSMQEIKLDNSRRFIQSKLRFQWWNFIHGVAFFLVFCNASKQKKAIVSHIE